ncbi:hypothetical protein LEP1GSC016_3141 [Leptospira borgpetersenii serovar Hardjo-bovis str. Sponselee]|uniref:Uncharacterized protein n=1 Tax=Leptospira borgpetersenii serovar Hardjo-bovis str. Sponselee TaxID=1303729 RepID=M6BP93_LEPBO|nr:hypothetical protein LEP1GSC016_3141 [Leptospira borgpetersenii serovar Hardjo-bovis str. Sponselee]
MSVFSGEVQSAYMFGLDMICEMLAGKVMRKKGGGSDPRP